MSQMKNLSLRIIELMNIKCFFAFWFNTYRYCPLNFISFTVIDYINENLDETIKLYRLFLELNIY